MPDKEKANPELWVTSYADYLYALALNSVQDTEVCKDLVQETFVAAIKNVSNFKGNSSEKTWLTSILKNKIIDHYRKKASEIMVGDIVTVNEQHDRFFETNGHWKKQYFPESWGIEETDYLENKELKNILEQCIKKLPALWAIVFNMKYLEEEDSKKICKELGISTSNFWVIIHRSRVSLRECISNNWLK
jgi:RNA polymerase sigma-70 factor (TIGR02943 family)